jgi:hypothetical protein
MAARGVVGPDPCSTTLLDRRQTLITRPDRIDDH